MQKYDLQTKTRMGAIAICGLYALAMMTKGIASAMTGPHTVLNVNLVEFVGAFLMHAWAASPFLGHGLLIWRIRNRCLLILCVVVIATSAAWGIHSYWEESAAFAERARAGVRGGMSFVIVGVPFFQWFAVLLLASAALTAHSIQVLTSKRPLRRKLGTSASGAG